MEDTYILLSDSFTSVKLIVLRKTTILKKENMMYMIYSLPTVAAK